MNSFDGALPAVPSTGIREANPIDSRCSMIATPLGKVEGRFNSCWISLNIPESVCFVMQRTDNRDEVGLAMRPVKAFRNSSHLGE